MNFFDDILAYIQQNKGVFMIILAVICLAGAIYMLFF
jgi:hypothetical protein